MSNAEPIFGRLLLTNDDGIAAPGLAVLEAVASRLAREVWVVAPEHDQSGSSHAISLHTPLRVSPQGERRFAVLGTPGDCVVMGLRHLLGGALPDMILSGVNRGANVGVETVFSGTVGAAMTGLLLGIPSIALSQTFRKGSPVPWNTAATLAPGVIRRLAGLGWSRQACLNVNFPDCPAERAGPLTLTRQGAGLLDDIDIVSRQDTRDIAYHWLQPRRRRVPDEPGGEATTVASGAVTVTPLRFERTDEAAYEALRGPLAMAAP